MKELQHICFVLGLVLGIQFSSYGYRQNNTLDSLSKALKNASGKERLTLLDDLSWELAEIDPDKAMKLAKEQAELADWLNDDAGMGSAQGNIAGAYWGKSQYKHALEHYMEGVAIRGRVGDRKGVANFLNNMGMIYREMGNYTHALEIYIQALKTYEAIGEDGRVKGNALNNIGIVHKNLGNVEDALDYYMQALTIHKSIGYTNGVGHTLNNIGNAYYHLKNYDKAATYFKESFDLQKSVGSLRGMGNALVNLSDVYHDSGLIEQALAYADSAYIAYDKADNREGLSNVYMAKARIWLALGNTAKSVEFGEKCHRLSRKIKLLDNVKKSSLLLSELYAKKLQFPKAYAFQKEYQQVHDSLVSEDIAKQLTHLHNNYEIEKKNLQISALQKEQELELYLIYGFIGLTISLVLLLFTLYKRYQLKQRANEALSRKNSEILQQKEEIETQRDHIEEQKDEIEAQTVHLKEANQNLEMAYQHISSSINYATRIQAAILGQKRRIISRFVDAFILFMPKDRVSGDFYWYYDFPSTDTENAGKSIIVCADCTGHGVPGAMMTVIGNTLLNEIVKVNRMSNPSEILHELDRKIQFTLNQDADSLQQDGMDLSLLSIDKSRNQVHFAGAKNSLLFVRDGEMERIQGSRAAIGGSFASYEKKFNSISLQLQDNDRLYMYSDGFQDQFGGDGNTKFLAKRFRQLIAEISSLPMHTQGEKLEMAFSEWKGDEEQTDDVLVIGMRF